MLRTMPCLPPLQSDRRLWFFCDSQISARWKRLPSIIETNNQAQDNPPALQAAWHLLELPQQLRQDPGRYKAGLTRGSGFSCSAPYVRQSLCHQWRQHPDLAKDPWPPVASHDDAVCTLGTGSPAGCYQAGPELLEKRVPASFTW